VSSALSRLVRYRMAETGDRIIRYRLAVGGIAVWLMWGGIAAVLAGLATIAYAFFGMRRSAPQAVAARV